MCNSIKNQPRTICRWMGRPVIVINETEDGIVYYHGVMIGPVGMTYPKALKLLDKAYTTAKKKAGDEWDYDDVLHEMRVAGFGEILAAVWDESDV